MTTSELVRRSGPLLVTGVIGSFVLATLVGKIWPHAFWGVFFGSILFWLAGMGNVGLREFRSRDTAVFRDPKEWRASELPLEFQFITHSTTLGGIAKRLGSYTNIADTGIVRYDLPSGGAIFIYFDPPADSDSKVCGIQLYRTEDSVPVFPT